MPYDNIIQGRIAEAHLATAWRWVQSAVRRAEEMGAIAPRKRIGTHTLRPAPIDEQNSDRLLVVLAGALVDSGEAPLPGACAGLVHKVDGHSLNLSW